MIENPELKKEIKKRFFIVNCYLLKRIFYYKDYQIIVKMATTYKVGDLVRLRFGGCAGLNTRSIIEDGILRPHVQKWEISEIYQNEYFKVRCAKDDVRGVIGVMFYDDNDYVTRSITRDDIVGEDLDLLRVELGQLCG